jgi:hypothetical protein
VFDSAFTTTATGPELIHVVLDSTLTLCNLKPVVPPQHRVSDRHPLPEYALITVCHVSHALLGRQTPVVTIQLEKVRKAKQHTTTTTTTTTTTPTTTRNGEARSGTGTRSRGWCRYRLKLHLLQADHVRLAVNELLAKPRAAHLPS